MYPVWRDGDPRYRTCWKGGEVTFDLRNDAPTLTGAKATFNIDVKFPVNQTVLPDGQVVWARNCTINGTQYREGQPVFPGRSSADEWTGVFPDGTPYTSRSEKKPNYIFVWKAWGRYWQVADGPSSSLTIGTDNIPLGSYNMEVVIYHSRSKDRFVPLGYASTRFSVIDQIPFQVTLSQVNDINQGDQNFIQNRAVAFSVTLHDPSQYLSSSDVTFTWDFGDNSGTLISRDPTVTHTYLSSGSFRPQVVLMAAIPNECEVNPTLGGATIEPSIPVEEDTTVSVAPTVASEAVVNEVDAGPEAAEVALVIAKRQAPEAAANSDCTIYRYGSFSTNLDIIQGIESVEIVQVNNVVTLTTEVEQNAVDLTVTCQGSLPSEVCTVVSDADCTTPVQTVCNAVTPSPECQMVLRQFFNDSGVFCINVSLSNDVSFAVTSARVSVAVGSESSTGGTVAAVLGVLVLACVAGMIALAYKRFKHYQPLVEDSSSDSGTSGRTSVPLLLWNLLSRQSVGESRPLLQGRVV
uniref:PKD domain-containing protein n=1 Tax=Denticeps clupeoides TaxID=299321 RepID=A0AAY4C8V2_9TELE